MSNTKNQPKGYLTIIREYSEADAEITRSLDKYMIDCSNKSRLETFLSMIGIKSAKRVFLKLPRYTRK